MFLQMKKSLSHEEFSKVSDFILQLFNFVVENKEYDQEKFLSEFSNQGDWYLSKSNDESGPVVAGFYNLFNLSIEERQILREVYLNDINFYNNSDSSTFELKAFNLSSPLKAAMHSFLVPFYSNIFNGKGFSEIGDFTNSAFDRFIFFEGYKSANLDSINVCPACTGQIEVIPTRVLVDLDHYFPKKDYPSLAISADNLIPLCSTCNAKIKLRESPIDNNGKGAIRRTFLPYKHSGMSEVNVKVTKDNRNKFKVNLLPKMEDEFIEIKIENFNRIYKITERWESSVEAHYEALLDELIVRYSEASIDSEVLRKEVEIQKSVAEIGEKKRAYAFFRKCFLECVLDDNSIQESILVDYKLRKGIGQ